MRTVARPPHVTCTVPRSLPAYLAATRHSGTAPGHGDATVHVVAPAGLGTTEARGVGLADDPARRGVPTDLLDHLAQNDAYADYVRLGEQQNLLAAWEGTPLWPRRQLFGHSVHVSAFRQTGAAHTRWLDKVKAHCDLCDEPVALLGTHTGYWDHCNMFLHLRTVAVYRRTWTAPRVTQSALGRAAEKHWQAAGSKTVDARRAQLRSLLVELSLPPHAGAPLRGTLTKALQGGWDWSMGGMGERQFREAVGRVMVPLLPPMSAQLQTRFQQKCWGRKNLEALYDSMDLGALEIDFGAAGRRTEKNDKGSFMRQVLSELLLITEMRGAADVVAEQRLSEVQLVAAEQALQGLTFELVAMTSQHYTERAEIVWKRNGQPTDPKALEALGIV